MSPGSGPLEVRACLSGLEREQSFDIRRSVLCGELHLNREAACDEDDASAYLALAWAGTRPVAAGRLLRRGEFWVLERLCVLPEQRRRGIGSALIGHFRERAVAQGARQVLVVCPPEALAFFRRAGFTVQEARPELSVLQLDLGA